MSHPVDKLTPEQKEALDVLVSIYGPVNVQMWEPTHPYYTGSIEVTADNGYTCAIDKEGIIHSESGEKLPDKTKEAIESIRALNYFEDGIPELEDTISDALDLEHIPDVEDYDGPMLVDKDGNGYAIVVQVIREPVPTIIKESK